MPCRTESGRKSLNLIELVGPAGSSGYYWSARKEEPFLFGSPGTDFGGPYQSKLEAAAEALCAHPPGVVALEPVVIVRHDLDEREGGWPVKGVTLKISVGMYPEEIGDSQPAGFVSETGLAEPLGRVIPNLRSSNSHLEVLRCDLIWNSVALSRKEGIPVLEMLVDARWRHPVRDNPVEFLRALTAQVSFPDLGVEGRQARHAFVFRPVPHERLLAT
jgi:hypothetical protein